jgi:hypothetical protein
MATPTPKPTATSGASDFAKQFAGKSGSSSAGIKSGTGTDDWKLIPAAWTTADVIKYQNILYAAGAYGKTRPIEGLWNKNVDGLAFKQALAYVNPKSDNAMTKDWTSVLNTMQTNPKAFQSQLGGASGGGSTNGSYTSKSSSINNLSDTDAQDYVQKNFVSVMGRMPNPAELKTYTQKLKDAVASNASNTTTTSTYANGKLVSSKSNSTGGLNPNQFMLNQLRTDAPNLIKSDRASGLSDVASANLLKVTQLAAEYGINVPDQHLLDLTESISKGKVQMADAENYIRTTAASAYPAYSNQILNQGLTPNQLASAKIGSMAKILEIDPNTITLNDPTIKKAMSATDASGNPVPVSQYEFERSLRKDPRWLNTDNAKSTISSLGLQTARDMGVAY